MIKNSLKILFAILFISASLFQGWPLMAATACMMMDGDQQMSSCCCAPEPASELQITAHQCVPCFDGTLPSSLLKFSPLLSGKLRPHEEIKKALFFNNPIFSPLNSEQVHHEFIHKRIRHFLTQNPKAPDLFILDLSLLI